MTADRRPCRNCGKRVTPLRRNMCNRCYENLRYRMKAYGTWAPDRVDAEPVRRHVQSLIDAGVARRKISRHAGIPRQTLNYLMSGRPGKPRPRRVYRSTADALLAVRADLPPAGEELVPAIGAQRRLRALVASGWNYTALSQRLGGTRSDVAYLIHEQRFVRAWKHEQIITVYNQLQLIPGPSEAARRLGRAKRWPLPFQWDEEALDDSAAGPVHRTRREPYMPRTTEGAAS